MRSVLAILVLVAAGIAGALMLDSDPAPPLADSDRNVQVDGRLESVAGMRAAELAANDRGDTSEASLGEHQRTTASVTDPGLFGQVLDHCGQPLVGLSIRLLLAGAHGNDAKWTRTDDLGRFAFADVHGKFECTTWSYVRVTKLVELAPGEHKNIVLQIDEPCVLVTGTVRAGTRPVADRTVGVHGKDDVGAVHHDEHTDEHGVYRHLLRPGSYTISIVGPPTSIAWSMKGTTIWAETATEATTEHPLELPATTTRVQRDFELPAARVRVAVRTPDNRPIGDASVTIRSDDGQSKSWSRRTDEDDGVITFEEMPAGRWTIIVSHSMHLTPAPKMVVTRSNDGLQTITMHMAPAGGARVKMMQGGELREPLDASHLELHIAGREPIRGTRSEASLWVYNGTSFEAVPVGTHELHCEDQRRPDGWIRFAPIEPIAPRAITIEAGKTTEMEICVKSRPHLSVTVVGGPETGTSIEVTCAQGRVVPSRRGHDYWRAEVPAGDYTVSVGRGDLQRTEQVSVFQSEVAHIIKLAQ